MPAKHILILGGTQDARLLAALLVAGSFAVTTSLAGVTETPVRPVGNMRQGGFGGAGGLAAYVQSGGFAAVVDATHPFATQISVNAIEACHQTGIPLLRLERPGWQPGPDDRWTLLRSIAEAAAAVPCGARVFLTIGRKEIAPFLARRDITGVARMIEPPGLELPDGWALLRDRPPYSIAAERQLMREHAITWLVTKNAGGSATEAKLAAARQLAIPVLMVERPEKPKVIAFPSAKLVTLELQRLLSP
jgi:precorrin-6A/cobalt-precorrin-6A reductase